MSSWMKANAILAVIAAGLLLSWATFAMARTAPSPLGNGLRADPGRFRIGTLDPVAASDATTFRDYPIAWLGEEFAGYKLTRMFHVVREGQDAVYLIYGDCEDAPGQPEPSCVPPLEIVTSAPGTVPEPTSESIVNAGRLTSVRGAPARALSGSPFIWTDGVTITIHANGPFVDDAIQGLRSANHGTLGYHEVDPGDSLRTFGR